MSRAPTILCILDGLGLNPNTVGNAVSQAKKPVLDNLFSTRPWTTLITNGTRVGLPDNHMGNSEVGHLNIGAGRVVEQWLYRISRELDEGFLKRSPQFNSFCNRAKPGAAVHLIGLFSYGGVHSEASHLKIVISELLERNIDKIVIHPILDGRDTPPTIAKRDVADLLSFIATKPQCTIGSLSGRFYSMDRDKRWERTNKAWNTIMLANGPQVYDPISHLDRCYKENVTDEFIEPVVIQKAPIEDDDLVLFFNFRADRMRQLVTAICDPSFSHFARERIHSKERTLCFTEYDPILGIPFLFEAIPIDNHLGGIISQAGLTQLRTAETEKYPHVTYFFNGLVEDPLLGEKRIMVPSPRDVKTYDLKPEMSAFAVRDVVIQALRSKTYDFIVINFANCDMVGHTGVLEAAIKAVEVVDECLGSILTELDKLQGLALIIADHGNAEQMIDCDTGVPHTAHTTFPVPAIFYGLKDQIRPRPDGALCDVAPTILKMMNLPQPPQMSGKSLY